MKLYKTARYQVKPEALEAVEAAMHEHARKLKAGFPGFLWWTLRDEAHPTRFLTLIIAPDEETNQRAAASEGNRHFVDVLYPNLVGEVEWTDWRPFSYTDAVWE